MPDKATLALYDGKVGASYRIGRVKDQNPELLRYLETLGVLPGAEICILEKAPFDGPVTIQMGAETFTLGYNIIRDIFLIPPSPQ